MKALLKTLLLCFLFLSCGIKGKPLPPIDNQSEAIQQKSTEDVNKKKLKNEN